MNTRHLVRAGAVVAALSVAGCVGGLGSKIGLGGGGSPARPAAQPAAAPAAASSTSSTPAPAGSAERPRSYSEGRDPEREKAYLAAAEKQRGTLGLLGELADGRGPQSDPARTLEQYRTAAGIDGFAKACADNAWAELNIPGLYPFVAPATACKNAAEASALLDPWLEAAATRFAASKLTQYESFLADLSKGESIVEDSLDALLDFEPVVAKWKAEVAPLDTERGKEMPADLFAAAEALPAQLPAAIAASKKAIELPRGHRDAAGEKAGRELLAAAKYNGAPLKIVGIRVAWEEWKVFTHQNGIPWDRIKMALGIAQAKGDDFCRMYPIELRQAYQGGGRWAKVPAAVTVRGPQIVSCR
jgi:hypothetical protein